MCQVSDKLKLCTCSQIELDKAEHYWIFYRRIKGKNNIIIGMPTLPNMIDDTVDLHNKTLLLSMLNVPDLFDCDLVPKTGDLLELTFTLKDHKQMTYGFKYKKG